MSSSPIPLTCLLYGLPAISLGLYLSFKPPTPKSSTPSSAPKRQQDTTLLGLCLTAFGLAFLFTPSLYRLNLPLLHLSVAGLASLVLLAQPRKLEDASTFTSLTCLLFCQLLPLLGTYAYSVFSNTQWVLLPKHPFNASNINLPLPLQLHAHGLIALGLYKTFQQPSKSDLSEPDSTAAGILGFGLGLGYLLTSSSPVEENQWLAASAPVRILLAILAATMLVVKRDSIRKETRNLLMAIAIYDAVGGAITGWWLGNNSGRVRV